MERARQRDGGERVCSYRTYADAQAAVDLLSNRNFPVECLSIVADDLQLVEDITGRREYATEAARGLFLGGLGGAVVASFLGLISVIDPLVPALALAIYGLLFGGLVGALVGLGTHWASTGSRDFFSSTTIRARRYHLVANAQVAPDAARLLGETPTPVSVS